MTQIETTPLTKSFGVEVHGLQIADVTKDHLFPELRALFEEHSALLLRNQAITDEQHIAFSQLFGEIEDRNADERKPDETFKVPEVSNIRQDGSVTDQMDLHTLNLQSNMLWHSDSTFLPVPALTNILIGRVIPSSGGNTELASTRAAWADMPENLKNKIRDRGIWHHYAVSRAKISEELSKLPMFHKWPAQHWKAVLQNPVNKKESLYVASHAYAVDGYNELESEELLEELIGFCTQDDYAYSHAWQEGDVLIWDQRAVMHRGTPWPYEEPRKLSSICISMKPEDGLGEMRPQA
ncbi:TauD/TfdA family dioxygenase [Shimia sp. SDUM112013]|uniref:TauD/TfdA dioxygenase family protein n=1 Tax=Shimia sp. SDUM112013 TaxID=3136160 RepID=UPI0032EE63E2